MRIERLYLKAFGPYAETEIDLGSTPCNFHLIVGPNEAGKSSLLQAIRTLLFGFHARNDSAFRHERLQQRVGAHLTNARGESLMFFRKKGRTTRDTLLHWDGAVPSDDGVVLPDDTLDPFLGMLTDAQFDSIFGLSHADLVSGGKSMLGGKGDAGELIFQAASGMRGLRAQQEALRERTKALFGSRGGKPINDVLSRWKEARSKIEEYSLQTDEHLQLKKKVAQLESEVGELAIRLQSSRLSVERMNRISGNLTLLGQLAEITAELAEAVHVPLLSAEFSKVRTELQTKRAYLIGQFNAANRKRLDLETQIGTYPTEWLILAEANAISELGDISGQYAAAARTRIEQQNEHTTRARQVFELLKDIDASRTLETCSDLRPRTDDAARAQALLRRHHELARDRHVVENRAAEAQTRLAKARVEIENSTVIADLDFEALDVILRTHPELRGDQNQLDRLTSRIETATVRLQSELRTFWKGSAEGLRVLGVPSEAVLVRIKDRLDALGERKRNCKRERASVERMITELQMVLADEGATVATISVDELTMARATRDLEWRLLSTIDLSREESRRKLYEGLVTHADRVADRRFEDSARVVRYEAALSALAVRKDELAGFGVASSQIEAELQAVEDEIRALGASLEITVATCEELKSWLAKREDWLRRFTESRVEIDESELLGKKLKRTGELLSAILRQEESTLVLAERASVELERYRRLSETRIRLEGERNDAEMVVSATTRELKVIDDAHLNWKEAWQFALRPFALGADAEMEQLEARLIALTKLFEGVDDLTRLEKSIRDSRGLEDNFVKLLELVHQRLERASSKESSIDSFNKLRSEFASARAAENSRAELFRRIHSVQMECENVEVELSNCDRRLVDLCKDARCDSVDDLARVEESSSRKRELSIRQHAIEDQLVTSNQRVIAELRAEASGVDADRLRIDIEDARTELGEAELKHNALLLELGHAQREVQKLDGGDRAALARQDAEDQLGKLETLSEEYVRSKLAASILERAITEYKDKNQNPIITRAGAHFATLTCGAFERLALDFTDDSDTIVAIRSATNGRAVPVTAMSEGTCDQLYLALRLAALERTIEQQGPMPLFVDDILIKFDDERAIAAMRVLEGLSRAFQIVLFTHHLHLVELAHQAFGTKKVRVHRLNRWVEDAPGLARTGS